MQAAGELKRAHFETSIAPKPRGRCRLLDGTVILAAGEQDVMGDPIRETIRVDGQSVRFDAIGVAAVRLDADGQVVALAAGGLRAFEAGSLSIDLEQRIDLALFREGGEWRGIVHGLRGDLPAVLTDITRRWTRVRIPTRYSAR